MSLATQRGTAMAWGKTAVHENDSSEHFGTQQCLICYTNVSNEQCVRFKPCGHEVCSLCMQELRKEAIRKVWASFGPAASYCQHRAFVRAAGHLRMVSNTHACQIDFVMVVLARLDRMTHGRTHCCGSRLQRFENR